MVVVWACNLYKFYIQDNFHCFQKRVNWYRAMSLERGKDTVVNQVLRSRRSQIELKRKFFGSRMSLLYDLGSIFVKWENLNVWIVESLKIHLQTIYVFVCPNFWWSIVVTLFILIAFVIGAEVFGWWTWRIAFIIGAEVVGWRTWQGWWGWRFFWELRGMIINRSISHC